MRFYRIAKMKLFSNFRKAVYAKVKRTDTTSIDMVDPVNRTVQALDPATSQSFPRNEVTNSKYTILTFIPYNIRDQFSRPLNRYFLLIAILQFINVIAPVNPLSTLLPLLFAFTITAIKEGFDDLQRHRQDNDMNNRTYIAWKDAATREECQRLSRDICVGDVIKIQTDEEIPCDIVVVQTSEGDTGHCYIRTDNLDGEIDLKRRCVAPDLLHITNSDVIQLAQGLATLSIECSPPDNRPYEFDSTLTFKGKKISIDKNQFLPQSCYLKKTQWVLGVVVYTGNETKCFMSKKPPPDKWSQLDQRVSNYAVFVFCFQISLAVVLGTTGSSLESLKAIPEVWYLSYRDTHWYESLIIPARFFLLTSVMIPISFKVLVDVSKYFISQLIMWDVEMYDAETGPAKVSNTAIAENLGQVQYVMTDKTGTLTENIMKFRACCCRGGFVAGIQEREKVVD
eukprot:PhF_6_TR44303/c1_g1_i1/m.68348/K01530/E3.6.3.1; phospholipid-translocating ATPase